jgi:hypothetical protein
MRREETNGHDREEMDRGGIGKVTSNAIIGI